MPCCDAVEMDPSIDVGHSTLLRRDAALDVALAMLPFLTTVCTPSDDETAAGAHLGLEFPPDISRSVAAFEEISAALAGP